VRILLRILLCTLLRALLGTLPRTLPRIREDSENLADIASQAPLSLSDPDEPGAGHIVEDGPAE